MKLGQILYILVFMPIQEQGISLLSHSNTGKGPKQPLYQLHVNDGRLYAGPWICWQNLVLLWMSAFRAPVAVIWKPVARNSTDSKVLETVA